jgi:hypothetical protein
MNHNNGWFNLNEGPPPPDYTLVVILVRKIGYAMEQSDELMLEPCYLERTIWKNCDGKLLAPYVTVTYWRWLPEFPPDAK